MSTTEGFIYGSALSVGIIVFLFLTVSNSGKISINTSYEEEFLACQEELSTATTPQCAPVICKNNYDIFNVFWGVLGILLWASGLWYWQRQFDKKEKQQVK